jgi:hypothetical protein
MYQRSNHLSSNTASIHVIDFRLPLKYNHQPLLQNR